MDNVPAYIEVPLGATPIPSPFKFHDTASPRIPSMQANGHAANGTVNGHTHLPRSISQVSLSFPPAAGSSNATPKKPGIANTISSNVSDLVLSTILPPNLPTLPSRPHVHGKKRELTMQKNALGIPLMTANFRRFVTKVGPIFWTWDRVEEVLFWHNPLVTWAFMATWAFISFNPRAILFFPTALLLMLYINLQEKKEPVPSLLGIPTTPTEIGTHRVGNGTAAYSTSNAPESEGSPTAPPKEAESSIDYLMNMQGIQNLLGFIADTVDAITPIFTYLAGNSKGPTTFPLAPAHVVLLLLPASIALPLVPTWIFPFVLLPVGIVPPLLFHPNLVSLFGQIPHARALRIGRYYLEDAVLTDCLNDEVGSKRIARIQVVENERLDPSVASKNNKDTTNGWSSRFLRTGERLPWVKIRESSAWGRDDLANNTANPSDEGKMVLALEEGWKFVPNEDWRVDVAALWSEAEPDAEGWIYTDDSWSNPGPMVVDDPAVLPIVSKRTTRQRRWWRRVYFDPAAVARKVPPVPPPPVKSPLRKASIAR